MESLASPLNVYLWMICPCDAPAATNSRATDRAAGAGRCDIGVILVSGVGRCRLAAGASIRAGVDGFTAFGRGQRPPSRQGDVVRDEADRPVARGDVHTL